MTAKRSFGKGISRALKGKGKGVSDLSNGQSVYETIRILRTSNLTISMILDYTILDAVGNLKQKYNRYAWTRVRTL